jgi:hypothetical protein
VKAPDASSLLPSRGSLGSGGVRFGTPQHIQGIGSWERSEWKAVPQSTRSSDLALVMGVLWPYADE